MFDYILRECIIVAILLYAALRLRVMIEKTGTSTAFNRVIQDLSSDTEGVSLGDSSFYVALYTDNSGQNLLSDSSYLTVEGSYIYADSSGGPGNSVTNTTTMSFSTCQNTSFSYSNEEELTKRNINSSFLCPDSLSYDIIGNQYSDISSYIKIKVKRCTGTDCQSSTAIDTAISGKSLGITLVNTYFDFDDYDEPVKTYLDDKSTFKFVSGYTKFVTLYAQQRSAEYKDSYIDVLSDPEEQEFVGVETITQDFDLESNNQDTLFEIYIRLDENQQDYSREVYSFLDVTGDLGGVFEILCIAAGFIVAYFSNPRFYYSILSNIYQVDGEKLKSSGKCKHIITAIHKFTLLSIKFLRNNQTL